MTGRHLLRAVLLAAGLTAATCAPAVTQVPGDTAAGLESAAVPPVSVHGRVLSGAGRLPVEGATVLVRDESGTPVGAAVSDEQGRYRLEELPPGRLVMHVRTADHRPHHVELRVPPAAELRLDVVLELDPPKLAPLLAVGERGGLAPAGPAESDGATQPGRRADPALRSLEAGPGGAWVGDAVAARPEPPESGPRGSLYVRGGAADLKRVYLDGAPVYTPFHLGGLMDALPDGVLRSARLYTGGAPLAYDGGLSYVLDLRTRAGDGDGPRLAGHADLMGLALRSEGGGPRASYLVSGRRVHADAASWLAGGDLPYRYRDLLGRADLYPADGHRVAITAFTNRESVSLGELPAEPSSPPGSATEAASWGNEAASLRYELEAGETRLLATAAASRFSSRLPVARDPIRSASSETRHARLAVDASTRVDGLTLSYGADFDDRRLSIGIPPGDGEPGVRLRGSGASVAAYAAATVRAAPGLTVRGGLRGHAFGDSSGLRLSPRLSLGWRAAEATTIELSAGRFHQRLSAPESVLASDLGTWTETLQRSADPGDAGAVARAELPALAVASASHVNVRLAHHPREELTLGLEGHFKTFDELAGGDDLHASGADLWVEWASEGWHAGGGYSLAWAWSDAPPDSGEATFSGRQLLSARARAPLPSGLRLTAKLRASSGLPFTRVPLTDGSTSGPGSAGPSPPEGSPTPGPPLAGPPEGSYLRLDLSISREWTTELLGRDATLRPYVRVLNALDQRDALFYHAGRAGRSRPRALDTMPLLPVVGLSWEVR